MENGPKPRPPVIVAVVHELLNVERFATHAELTDAVKRRCARLRIRYDAGLVCAALDVVARTRPLLTGRQPAPAPAPRRDVQTFAVTRETARELMAQIRQRLAGAR